MQTSYFIMNTLLTLSLAVFSNRGWTDATFTMYGFHYPQCSDAAIKDNLKQKLNNINQRYEQNDNWNYQLWFLIVQNTLEPIYIKLNKYDLKAALLDFARQVAPLK